MKVKTFGRWKYAEEYAKGLIDKGRLVTLTMRPDVEHPDGDEVYVNDEFDVVDLGPRPKR